VTLAERAARIPWPAILRAVLVSVAYFAGARVGYGLAIGKGLVALWPPSGIMLALLLLSPPRQWTPIVVGGFAGSVASDLLTGYTPLVALFAAFANILESFVAARLLVAWLGTPVRLSTVRAFLVMTFGAVLGSNALTAILGAVMLKVGFNMSLSLGWFFWWIGDGLGMLVLAPLLLTWAGLPRTLRVHRPLARVVEAAFLLLLLAGVSVLALGPASGSPFQPGPYFVFPLLLWAAVRFGPPGAATATVIVAAFSTWFASVGSGPFAAAGGSDTATTFQVYGFLVVASLSSLTVAVALEERRAATQQMRQSETRYRDVVEAATDAIVRIDDRSRIQFANSATAAIFGHPADSFIGRDLKELIPESLTGPGAEGLKGWNGRVLAGRHQDGREIPLEVSLGESYVDGRREFTGILRDISEKQAAEASLQAVHARYRQSQKMEAVGRLAGGIAHDFNNILTVIQVNTELLMTAADQPAQAAVELEEIRAAAGRAAALTHQLLAFSRRQVLAPRVLRLQETVAAIEPMLKRLIGVEISVETESSGTGLVLADPGQMEQVIMNLAINARDAMPEGGTLRLDVADVELSDAFAASLDLAPGHYVRLQVSDTGTGMDASTLAQILEPFFTTKPVGQGTGLGLATVDGIVKQSNGGIEVRSEVGRGTTFAIYLPRVADAP
jgi:PAS domain S-box-containing protein